tara:strand:- start:746 stop:1192 length:447 start_codon:yes stop_codon:yes gene_type:complete
VPINIIFRGQAQGFVRVKGKLVVNFKVGVQITDVHGISSHEGLVRLLIREWVKVYHVKVGEHDIVELDLNYLPVVCNPFDIKAKGELPQVAGIFGELRDFVKAIEQLEPFMAQPNVGEHKDKLGTIEGGGGSVHVLFPMLNHKVEPVS